jgi:cytochrome P450
MTRDEEVYQDADSFRPERFIKADGTLNDDTVDYAFGFGRRYVAFTPALVQNADMCRICPGRAFAETEVRYLVPSRLNGENNILIDMASDGIHPIFLQCR